MKEFLKVLEKDFKIIKIEDEISTKYEVAKNLKKYDKDVVIFENIKESDMSIISGICNTRQKIAASISATVPQITSRIVEATENPTPIEKLRKLDKISRRRWMLTSVNYQYPLITKRMVELILQQEL